MFSFLQTLMKKFISLGTECVKFLKAARASQGKLLCYVVSSACLVCLSLILCSTFFSLFRAADALSTANAPIASLEAELEASQKAWDVATATKAAAEKSTKAAATKAKRAEKALVDADQGHIQREQAITKHLNQVLALAGGKYLFALFLVYLLILRLANICSLSLVSAFCVSVGKIGVPLAPLQPDDKDPLMAAVNLLELN
jgi:hypothetical protein